MATRVGVRVAHRTKGTRMNPYEEGEEWLRKAVK
jgi:hypothetical protein